MSSFQCGSARTPASTHTRTFASRGSPTLGWRASSVAGPSLVRSATLRSWICGPPQAMTKHNSARMHLTFPVDPGPCKPHHHAMTARLLLDERILGDGTLAKTYASCVGGQLLVTDDHGTDGTLSIAALDRVMVRYGVPLAPGVELAGDALEVGDGRRLRRLHYHAPVDAEGRDYLVWERAGQEPLAVIATHATAALRYLVLRLDGERG